SLSSAAFFSPISQELGYGTIRWYYRLNGILKLLVKDTKKLDSLIRILLLVGLYQLIYLRKPDYAVLNETVEATKYLDKPWATALVNAVLRNFLRQQKILLAKLESNEITKYSHPLWIINALKKAYPKQWKNILIANNQYPPMHLRVNKQQISQSDYLKLLPSQNITLEKPRNVTDLPGFQDGLVSVQDLSAQYTTTLLDLKPGQIVLDACAAPGGKTAHILETEPHLQKLIVCDIDELRLNKVRENLTRLKLDYKEIIKFIFCDITITHELDNIIFDRILLDAPCSGSGVIRRHPDIKLLRQEQDVRNKAEYQLVLLKKLWPKLKPDGILVYSTCSVFPEENNLVIEKFLLLFPDAKEIFCKQILPKQGEGDGFFYSVLCKS
ncbi:MAG: hypothetical protein ACD_82C00190G0003, partial [uncultured bacterium]